MVDEVRVFKLCFYIMSSFATEDQCWNTDTWHQTTRVVLCEFMLTAFWYECFTRYNLKKKQYWRQNGCHVTRERTQKSNMITCPLLWLQFELWSSQKQPLDIFSITSVKSPYERKSCIYVPTWLGMFVVTSQQTATWVDEPACCEYYF